MNFSEDELADMVLVLGECYNNSLLACRVYKQKYPERRAPQVSAFKRVLDRFLTKKVVHYQKNTRQQPILNEDNQLQVMAAVVEDPHRSVRDISRLLNISKTSVSRIIIKHKFHPYHVELHQALYEHDFEQRIRFCEWASEKINIDFNFFNNVMFSDESTFHRNGHINRHNLHFYADENPHLIRQVDAQHRWSINVWAGIVGERVIGPYFFNRTLTIEIYLDFLSNILPELLEDVPLNIRRIMWIQHDGAPAHFSRQVLRFLNRNYPDRWIGRGSRFPWPPRSPDLTKLDFFFWGFIKSVVYNIPPTTRQDMMERIRQAFTMVTPEMLVKVNMEMHERIRICLQQNGRHFEQLLT